MSKNNKKNNKNKNKNDIVYNPSHYTSSGIETIEKIEHVIDGLNSREAAALANVLKYFDRAGKKEGNDYIQDLNKANNYAHRLTTGHWRTSK